MRSTTLTRSIWWSLTLILYFFSFTNASFGMWVSVLRKNIVFVFLSNRYGRSALERQNPIKTIWRNVYVPDQGICKVNTLHCSDVIMSAMASQITCVFILYSTVCSGTYQRKLQSSASLAFVWPVNSRHKGPVARKMFPFDDVIVMTHQIYSMEDFC